MTDGQADDIEQFSPESSDQLRRSTATLVAALERHTAALLDPSAKTSPVPLLFGLNDEVKSAAASWDDAVYDHTGTFPLALELDDDDLDDDDLDDEEGEGPRGVVTQLSVSVVSRWDLDITDVAVLIEAGLAADRRMDPAAAEFHVGENGVGQALYALAHEHGEPWFGLPGVRGVAGYRAYLRRDDDQLALDDDDEEQPFVPNGEVLFSESW